MTLTELRYFTALARELHFGRAAAQCFVSQPTLSVAIKKLEEQLDVALFERASQEIRLTEAGQRLLPQAHRVLEEAEQFKQLAKGHTDPLAEPIRLGAIYTVAPYLFPRLVPAIKARAPQLPLLLEDNFTASLDERLAAGQVDAIVVAAPFSAPGIVSTGLYDEEFVVAMPASHPLAGREAIEVHELMQQDLLMLGSGHCFRDQVLNFCARIQSGERGELQHMVEGSSLETIRQMVAAGVGITVLPKSAVNPQTASPLVVTRPFVAPVPSRQMVLAWRASFPRPAAIEVIIQALRACGSVVDTST